MDENQKAQEEVAAASGFNSRRFVALVRFVSLLVDQTTEANLSPGEMKYVAAVFKNTVDLFAIAEQGK